MFPFARSKSVAGLSGVETMGMGATGSASTTSGAAAGTGIGVVGERRRRAASTNKPATSATAATSAIAAITARDDDDEDDLLVPLVATGAGVVVAGGAIVTTAVQEPESSRRRSSLMPSESSPPTRARNVVRTPTSNGDDEPIRAIKDRQVRFGAGQRNPRTGVGHLRSRPAGATRSMGAGPKCISPVALIVMESPERTTTPVAVQ